MKTKKAQNQKKPGKGAPLRRYYVVEWGGKRCAPYLAFLNLARARRYAKETAATMRRILARRHKKDGKLAVFIDPIRIYAGVLEPVAAPLM